MERKKVQLVEIEVDGVLVDAKECTKCGIVKPLNEYNKRPRGLGGKDSRCRQCYNDLTKEKKADYDRVYCQKNKEKIREYKKEYSIKNSEILKIKNQEYYQNNKQAHLSKCKEWAQANKEKVRAYARKSAKKYRENNPDYVEKCRIDSKNKYHENKEMYSQRWKEYFKTNKEQIRKRQREFYNSNREEVTKRWRSYYKTPKGQLASKRASHRRREAEKLSISTLTPKQWEECAFHFGECCVYCGKKGKLTMDHFHPVSKGGELTVKNVVPACSSCNYSKRDSLFFDWYPKQKFYSAAREKKILKYLGIKENTQQIAMF